MPILDKMTGGNTPDDNGDSGSRFDNIKPDRRTRRPKPTFLESRMGRRQVSFAALIERICDEFRAEYLHTDEALRELATRADRLKLLHPVIEYVISVESVALDDEQKADVIRAAYSELFGFGPLDALIEDETITTIALEGDNKVSVRHGHGELEPIDPIFEDISQFKDVVGRLLQRSGAVLLDNIPLIETGCVSEGGRFMSISLAAPPVTFVLSLDIRIHPVGAPNLMQFIENNMLTEAAASLLRAIVHSEHGFMVVGQPESGKTMTLGALLAELPNPEQTVAIERTGELHLPDGVERVVVEWSRSVDDPGVTFGAQIESQLEKNYAVMVLDEVRADEPHTIAPLLRMQNPPRMIWSFRGAPDSKRLVAALGMLARRGDVAAGEEVVRNLYERIPFVISVRRLNGQIQLREVGEFVFREDSDYVNYQPLLQNIMGEISLTGHKAVHDLSG